MICHANAVCHVLPPLRAPDFSTRLLRVLTGIGSSRYRMKNISYEKSAMLRRSRAATHYVKYKARGLSRGLDTAHVAGRGHPGPEQPEEDADTDDGRGLHEIERRNGNIALVQTGETSDGPLQHVQPVINQRQRHQPAKQAVPEAGPEKRPPNERVGRTDEFGHLDFVATILDVETNRIADDDDDRDAEQRRANRDCLPHDIQDRMKTLHPLGIDLHVIRFRKVADFLLQQNHRCAGVARTGPYNERMRQRVVRQLVERRAEARLLLELRQSLCRPDELDRIDVGALPDEPAEPRASSSASPVSGTPKNRAHCPSCR